MTSRIDDQLRLASIELPYTEHRMNEWTLSISGEGKKTKCAARGEKKSNKLRFHIDCTLTPLLRVSARLAKLIFIAIVSPESHALMRLLLDAIRYATSAHFWLIHRMLPNGTRRVRSYQQPINSIKLNLHKFLRCSTSSSSYLFGVFVVCRSVLFV